MLKVPDVELPNTAVCADGCEDIPISGEMNVIDFLVMGDELREDCAFLNVPDGAGSIDGGIANQVFEFGVPVE